MKAMTAVITLMMEAIRTAETSVYCPHHEGDDCHDHPDDGGYTHL
jgi:hypothetical protein